jgi:hypothetical protein
MFTSMTFGIYRSPLRVDLPVYLNSRRKYTFLKTMFKLLPIEITFQVCFDTGAECSRVGCVRQRQVFSFDVRGQLGGIVSPMIPCLPDDIAHTLESTFDGSDARTDTKPLQLGRRISCARERVASTSPRSQYEALFQAKVIHQVTSWSLAIVNSPTPGRSGPIHRIPFLVRSSYRNS